MRPIEHYVISQNLKRELWEGNDAPEEIVRMVADEVQELKDAINESFVTGDVFSVASEIGDVLYLMHRLCFHLGIDADQATEMKVFRNAYKYQDHLMSNGRDYKEATKIAKESWKALGGDYAFSHAYLDFLAHDEPML